MEFIYWQILCEPMVHNLESGVYKAIINTNFAVLKIDRKFIFGIKRSILTRKKLIKRFEGSSYMELMIKGIGNINFVNGKNYEKWKTIGYEDIFWDNEKQIFKRGLVSKGNFDIADELTVREWDSIFKTRMCMIDDILVLEDDGFYFIEKYNNVMANTFLSKTVKLNYNQLEDWLDIF